jgi:hypothetical protein
MNSTWSLKSARQPRYPLGDAEGLAIRTAFTQLEATAELPPFKADCMTCVNKANAYGAQLGDGPSDNFFIIGDTAYLGREKRRDPKGNFLNFYKRLFSQLTLTVQPISAARFIESAEPKDRAAGELLYVPCECGGPDDFDDWARDNTCLCNSCYNYAVKDRWISTTPNGGTTPSLGVPKVKDWIAVLEQDGLEHVATWNTAPKKPSPKGWYVALALDSGQFTNAHFLRLDGNAWSHKWSSYPPQLCDLAGKAMPKDKILEADLCEYKIKAFFFVPHPLKVGR